MSETNLTNLSYHCPICINDFTDEGIQPFQCLHKLCNDCNEQFKNSTSKYKCPLCRLLCKSDVIDNQTKKDMLELNGNV